MGKTTTTGGRDPRLKHTRTRNVHVPRIDTHLQRILYSCICISMHMHVIYHVRVSISPQRLYHAAPTLRVKTPIAIRQATRSAAFYTPTVPRLFACRACRRAPMLTGTSALLYARAVLSCPLSRALASTRTRTHTNAPPTRCHMQASRDAGMTRADNRQPRHTQRRPAATKPSHTRAAAANQQPAPRKLASAHTNSARA